MIKNIGKITSEEKFKDFKIKKIAEHYYLPLIYSTNEKVDYIKHVIKIPSEVKFIKNLEIFINNNKDKIKHQWMFSKIDESFDSKMGIPYFDEEANDYRNFYPDFIFWIKKKTMIIK